MISLEQMRQERLGYIGASDIGALLLDHDGHPIHPYKTPHDVWIDKTGNGAFEETERTVMGQLLEPLVTKRFEAKNPGVRAKRCGTVRGAKDHHACNPDRIIVQRVSQVPGTVIVAPDPKGAKAVLQLKSAGYFGARDMGQEGTDELHDWYLAQCQWELYCTGFDLCVLGLLYDTHLYRQFIVWRDQELIDTLVRVADHFWQTYIVGGKEPPVTGHQKDKEWLQTAWEPKNDTYIVADAETDKDVQALASELPKLERLTNIVEGRKSRIKAYMGECGTLGTSVGELIWKADKNGKRSMRLSGIKNKEAAA